MNSQSASECVIEIAGLTRRFGPKVAVNDVSLSVRRGRIFGLVGENGAGKTTLIRHLLGLLKAERGTVRVFGLDPVTEPVVVLGRTGYLSENRDLPGWMRVDELLHYSQAFYPRWDQAYAEALRQQFGLEPKARIKHLSRGEVARAGLLVALAYRPELLVLDEPSSGLDPVVRRDILEAIIRTVADEGRTVFFSSHLLEEVERVADDVAMMVEGKIALAGPLDEIKESHHQLTLQFEQPQPRPPTLAGALRVTGAGREWTFTCNGARPELMNSPAFAIAWEIWRKSRLGNLLCLGCIAVFAIQALAWAVWKPASRVEPALVGEAVLILFYPMLATFVWVLNTFAHTDWDQRKGFSGVPRRMFILPMQTRALVGWMMLDGVAAIVAWYVTWVEFVWRPFGISLPLGWPLLMCAVAMVSFQTAVWALASFPWIRIAVICGGAVALLVVCAVGFGNGAPDWLPRDLLVALMLAWLPLMYAVAVLGVNAERRGGWNAWVWLRPAITRIADALPRWRGPFTSAAQAQMWIEWRRKGWLLTLGLALSIAGGVLFLPVAGLMEAMSIRLPVAGMIFLSALVFPLIFAGVNVMNLAKADFWSSEVALPAFCGVRPLTDRELVLAKLKIAAAVTLLGWLIGVLLAGVFPGVIVGWDRWWGLLNLPAENQPSPLTVLKAQGAVAIASTVIAAVAITWQSTIVSLSVGLIGRKKVITARSFIGMAIFSATVAGVGWFSLHPTDDPVLLASFYLGLIALGGWKVHATIRSFAEVRRRGLLDTRDCRLAFLLWLAVATCLLAWYGALWHSAVMPGALRNLLLAWFWPAGELPQCVLNLAANRHR
jgi:ABC-2 type transport system ATP-binding protein